MFTRAVGLTLRRFASTDAVGTLRRFASTDAASFLARAAAANDSQALLGKFPSAGRFDATLADADLTTTKIGKDGVECTIQVTPGLTNNFGTLHGGATATLIDVVGTLALLGRDPMRPGVSVEMNQSVGAAAKEGETLHCYGTVLKSGKVLGFTEVEVRGEPAADGALGRLIATGRHTKFLAL